MGLLALLLGTYASGAAWAAGDSTVLDDPWLADALPAKPATGDGTCDSLPRSALEVYDLRATPMHRVVVDVPDLRAREEDSPDMVTGHAQPAMATTGHFVTFVNVEHQNIPAPAGGGYCDSPVKVRIGIGYSARQVYMTQAAASDDCVQDILMEHAAKHAQAEDDLLGRFLSDEKVWLGRHLTALKRKSAPTAVAAQDHFMAGSIALAREARQHFLASNTALTRKIDGPDEMQRLNSACGGRVGQIGLQPNQPI